MQAILKRARKSADIISGILDLPVHYTKRLREMNFGKAEGLKKNDLEAVFPYIYQAFNDIKKPRTLRYRLPRRGNDRRSAAAFYEIYTTNCLKKGGSACCWLRTECSSAFLPKYV